jgi:Zn-dependent peptidase ImmA (M78 family)
VAPDVPEDVAGDLVRASGQASPPIDLNGILALLPGVSVTFEELDNDGYIFEIPGGAEILINVATKPERQRFTLAHEMGHHVLSSGLVAERDFHTHAERERWCDRFAVELLMPRKWVTDLIDTRSPRRRAAFVARGHRTFGVSRTAFRLRVEELIEVWIVELTREGTHFAKDRREDIPAEAVALASKCAELLTRGDVKVLRTHHFEATCMKVASDDLQRSHYVAIVGPSESRHP